VFKEPEPMTWQLGDVQFSVSPQPACAFAVAHRADHKSTARISFDFIIQLAAYQEPARGIKTLPATFIICKFQGELGHVRNRKYIE
jgi:hypothetical protein